MSKKKVRQWRKDLERAETNEKEYIENLKVKQDLEVILATYKK